MLSGMTKKKKIDEANMIYILSGIVFLVGIGLLVWFGLPGQQMREGEDEVTEKEKDECHIRSALNGVCVENESEIHTDLVAIMIENHPAARPLSGIDEAKVVYEAPVEANITRFLALFEKNANVDQVGPVRSARPYYLDWLSEWGAPMYMHVGGSPSAMEQIEERNIFHIDEFNRGWYFWRSEHRVAPHNTYTSHKLWDKAWDDYGDNLNTDIIPSWKFGEITPCEEQCISEITIDFAGATFTPTWKYVSSTQEYVRHLFGKPEKTLDGKTLTADTIIVQHVLSQIVDDIGRKRIETGGRGKALIFQKGHVIEAGWSKQAREKTKWVDENDSPIPLNPGTIWIEITPQDAELSYE